MESFVRVRTRPHSYSSVTYRSSYRSTPERALPRYLRFYNQERTPTMQNSLAWARSKKQARQESNLQPPVLETGALPIELRT